jgi:pyrrolidone-carboxylate peptidase
MTTTRSDEGTLIDDTGASEEELLFAADGIEVRESTWAGAYYCAHVLWLQHGHARAPSTSIARDRQGDALVGFIHVPADAETAATSPDRSPDRSRRERHARTARVVACALRGVVDELEAIGKTQPRVLLTGFGPFAAVASNPTGDFIEHDESVSHALELALGTRRERLELQRARLDVEDSALDPAHARSLPSLIEQVKPHAVIGLGVHRASTIYRVEIDATNAGLRLVDGEPPRHERGLAPRDRPSRNRALARAIVHGAKVLGL